MEQAINATTIKTGKYLTFILENEEYGIGITQSKGNYRNDGDDLCSPDTGICKRGD